VATVAIALPSLATGGDWPTYRHDNSRSAVTEESLTMPLTDCWSFKPLHAPQPAWGDPNPRPVGGWYGATELRRVHFDDAYQVAAVDGAVYFGSSADGKVVSLDATTGQQRWSFMTGGPVRLAPTVWKGNVYAASDDGFVYCLSTGDGALKWKFRAAPSDRKVLGNGKTISLWPIRTGVLVDDGIAYFGAGIFPAEGVYLYAVDAENGKLIWCNDSSADAPQSRISPQGYMLASESRLFTPLGRVSPAAFDRKDGRLLYEAYIEHIVGGTYAMLDGTQLFTGTQQLIGYDEASHRSRSSWFWGHRLIVTPDLFYVATGNELYAVKRKEYSPASLVRKTLLDQKRSLTTQLAQAKRGPEEALKRVQAQMDALNERLAKTEADLAAGEAWRVICDCSETLLLAGNTLVAGGDGRVAAFDRASGSPLWTGKVEGTARGLAVADGRLLVSSDTGAIQCFGEKGSKAFGTVPQPVNPSPFPADDLAPVYEAAAEHIVQTTGIKRGYCLMLGCGTGRLAYELTKRTDLHIYGVEPDPKKAQAARQSLDAAGVYGARVVIDDGDLSQIPMADYFANLVVSEEALISGQMPGSAKEAFRMLKPLGGTIQIGQPAEAKGKVKPLSEAAMRQWVAKADIDGGQVSEKDGAWLELCRGPLPGAGSWTHQYANPGNTTCSDDELVRCPLGVLWFGAPGPTQMAERHRRAAAPLGINGRMFILGEGEANRIGAAENSIMAYDAYNGLELWQRKIRGALRTTVTHDAGNSAANDDSLFVAVDDKCLRLDAATGETKLTYELPAAADGQPRRWGYVGVVGDLLYGSRTVKQRVADCVFALDLASGELRWKHEVQGIGQGSIAIGDGKFFFASSDVTEQQRLKALAEQTKALHRMGKEDRDALLKELDAAAVYQVVALDAAKGNTLWQKPVEVTGAAGGSYWCSLGSIYKDDTLMLFGVFLDGHYWKQFFSGLFEQRRVVALATGDGELRWQKRIGYRVRPIVVGDTFHAEPWAYDLQTGEQKTRIHPVTGQEEAWQFARPGHHCGCPAAAPHALLFRSATIAWYDLDKDFGTQHFGSQRPGCWINFIPANGLLMVPEASSGCMCPFPNACTIVFKSKDKEEEERQWAYFSSPGELTPVKRLALNLGAPGDRKDDADSLWLGYPRPGGSLVLQWKAGISLLPGGAYFKHDPARLKIEGTDKPWVFCSGLRGLRQCTLPLAESVDGKARYTVRLAFSELDNDAPGKRVFDIKLQGKVVAEGFDVFKEAGGKNRAIIKEFTGVNVDDTLTLEFVPRTTGSEPDKLPILQGIEVEREKVLTLGLGVPTFLLNDAEPEQEGQLLIVNNKSKDFAGTLRIECPEGFTIAPDEAQLKIASGQRATVKLKAAVAQKGKPAKHAVSIALVEANGTVASECETELEYLGDLRRTVLKAVEDTHAQQLAPDKNNATATALNVDGGDRKLGDHHHSVAYLKFRVAVEGKPVSAMLRLYNAGNPTGNSGQIRLVESPWKEADVTYKSLPKLGKILAKIGPVTENQVIELPLEFTPTGNQEVSLAIEPTGCDGVNYITREGGKPAELVVEYIK
jgi:outer membrane protein assembly factor BamB